MVPSEQLLRSYADEKCERAFAELVERHINVVYGAALRQVRGDADLARDIVQSVFTDLARKGSRVSGSVGGWLYRHTCFDCQD